MIKDATGKVVPGGCHSSKGDALDHAAALYANEKGAMHVNNPLGQRQVRATSLQLRDIDEGGKFAATVMTYRVIDDYGTDFEPKVFDASLQRRLPRVVWGHDWTDPIGRYIAYEDTQTRLDLVGQLDMSMIEVNTDGSIVAIQPAVPRAHQAYAQLRSGTIDQFSVGFYPEDGYEFEQDGQYYFRFTRARLDEVSLVLVGAVHGTKLLGVRDARPIRVRSEAVISKEKAAALVLDLHQGKIDLADALQAIKLEQFAASEAGSESGTGEGDAPDTPTTDPQDPPGGEPSDPPVVGDEPPGGSDPEEPEQEQEETQPDLSDLADVDDLVHSLLA